MNAGVVAVLVCSSLCGLMGRSCCCARVSMSAGSPEMCFSGIRSKHVSSVLERTETHGTLPGFHGASGYLSSL